MPMALHPALPGTPHACARRCAKTCIVPDVRHVGSTRLLSYCRCACRLVSVRCEQTAHDPVPRLVGLSLSPARHVEWSTTAVVSLSHTCQLLVHSSYTATVCRLSLVCTSTQPSSFIGDSKDVPCGPPKQMLARCTLEPRHTAPIAMSDIDDPHTPELRTATMS
jgi:hypothetical protein